MFLSSKTKLSRRLTGFILALILTGLAAGCTEQASTTTPPSPPPQLTPAVFKPALPDPPVLNRSTVPAASPTTAPLFLPAAPTAPPTALPEMVASTATPGLTPAESQDQALAGNVPSTVPGLKVSDLPLFKGLPKIPLTNLPPPVEPAAPARKANYGANGKPKIGIQAGHWMIEQLPDQLASLRGQTGGAGGGVREVDFTLDVARRVTKLLQDQGYEVDLLPATVPADYTVDAFVAIHADASTAAGPNGYKVARSRFSPIPLTDDALLKALTTSYGAATGLGRDNNISRNMTGYYAFNSRRRVYAVSKGTPAVIIETGYLTSPGDRAYLLSNKATLANGIAQGVITFLNTRPPLAQREKPSQPLPGVVVSQDNTPVYDRPNGRPMAYLTKDQGFEVYEVQGDYYMVFLPYLNKAGFMRRTAAANITPPH